MLPHHRLLLAYGAAFAVACAGPMVFMAGVSHASKRPSHPQRITYVYDQRSQRCSALLQWCAGQAPEVRPIACADALCALGVPDSGLEER